MLSADVFFGGDEAYELTCEGKKASIVETNRPIRKTLRPCKEERANWNMKALPKCSNQHSGFHIVFEYALPYKSGRRPDVVLVSNEFLIIPEFKKKNTVLRSGIDQTAAYLRDIEEYHYESRKGGYYECPQPKELVVEDMWDRDGRPLLFAILFPSAKCNSYR